jgi:carbon dioxide concentrating mechanism protein CcmO
MVILDALEKSASVRVLQSELNDQPGVCMKLAGSVSDVQSAAAAARAAADGMHVTIVTDAIPGPAAEFRPAWDARPEYNPLIEQAAVSIPAGAKGKNEKRMSEQAGSFAVGLIETQGFTAVFEAIDTAVKTAAVEVLAREKLGGGYITVVIKGDVAAVRAAVEAGSARVNGLGKLIAAHVIPNPSAGVLALLPK